MQGLGLCLQAVWQGIRHEWIWVLLMLVGVEEYRRPLGRGKKWSKPSFCFLARSYVGITAHLTSTKSFTHFHIILYFISSPQTRSWQAGPWSLPREYSWGSSPKFGVLVTSFFSHTHLPYPHLLCQPLVCFSIFMSLFLFSFAFSFVF